jgi:hypothetical protein
MGEAYFDGVALEKALAEHKFNKSSTQLIGMVKSSEKPGCVSFTPAGCDSWVDVPSDMIAEAEHIGHQPCKDHSHPVFRLLLKEPTDPQAKVLMALLAARAPNPPTVPTNFGGFSRASRDAGSLSPMMSEGCSSYCSGPTLWCRCPVYIPGIGRSILLYPCGTCINDPVFTAFAPTYLDRMPI